MLTGALTASLGASLWTALLVMAAASAADSAASEEEGDCSLRPGKMSGCGRSKESVPMLLPRRTRRNAHSHAQALDPNYLHLPAAALEYLPDGISACDAMRNASVLRQVVPPQLDVLVEPPCPVRMRLLEDPQRVWPARLMVAECACPATSCRPRTAYVCTQIISPSVVVMAEGDGHYRQHRVMLPSGCKCMTARAALIEYLDEDYK